nr:immunoglobulin heavy chain junction region [Mus musculus]
SVQDISLSMVTLTT